MGLSPLRICRRLSEVRARTARLPRTEKWQAQTSTRVDLIKKYLTTQKRKKPKGFVLTLPTGDICFSPNAATQQTLANAPIIAVKQHQEVSTSHHSSHRSSHINKSQGFSKTSLFIPGPACSEQGCPPLPSILPRIRLVHCRNLPRNGRPLELPAQRLAALLALELLPF